jgi:hypothetical protein
MDEIWDPVSGPSDMQTFAVKIEGLLNDGRCTLTEMWSLQSPDQDSTAARRCLKCFILVEILRRGSSY